MATIIPPGMSGRAVRKDLMVEFVDEYLRQHGVPPTLREIAPEIGLAPGSWGTVKIYADELVKEGRLRRGAGKRNLTTTGKVEIK